MSAQILCPFKIELCDFFVVVILLKLWTLATYQIYDLQTFSPVLFSFSLC